MSGYNYRPLSEDTDARLQVLDHAEHLLSSDVITLESLRRVAKRFEVPVSGKKDEVANRLAHLIRDDDRPAQAVAAQYCREPKTWMALLIGEIGEPTSFQRKERVAEFVKKHGSKGVSAWYGPIRIDGTPHYIFSRSIRQKIIDEDDEVVECYMRWSCVAQVLNDGIVLHWDNPSYRDQRGESADQRRVQFPYWRDMNAVKTQLEQILDAELSYPNLHNLVLNEIWDLYEAAGDTEWTHERIRADSRGVALSASGAKQTDVEIDASGIVALTLVLAEAAADEVGVPDKAEVLQRRLLRTLIHEWHPKSYQFQLTGVDGHEPFRGHVYFGTGAFGGNVDGARTGPDAFPHIKCYAKFGGSPAAAGFLRAHLVE